MSYTYTHTVTQEWWGLLNNARGLLIDRRISNMATTEEVRILNLLEECADIHLEPAYTKARHEAVAVLEAAANQADSDAIAKLEDRVSALESAFAAIQQIHIQQEK